MSTNPRVVCWFSAGAPSAVAAKLAILDFPDHEVVIAYCDTGSEHPDNLRFIKDCEKWFEQEVVMLKNPKYEDTWDVYEKENYLVGHIGARCSLELKKRVREKFQHQDDIQVFGYDASESKRADRFRASNPDVVLDTPLIRRGLTKRDCKNILSDFGIEIPVMYKLGYKNNNCIGCVKGQKGYWNKIRKDFPDTFDRMAKIERRLGISINANTHKKDPITGKVVRVYLDELPPDAGNYKEEPDISCGITCTDAIADIWEMSREELEAEMDDCDV